MKELRDLPLALEFDDGYSSKRYLKNFRKPSSLQCSCYYVYWFLRFFDIYSGKYKVHVTARERATTR